MKSILIFGKGQLGQAYRQYFESKPDAWKVYVSESVDVRDLEGVRKVVQEIRPDVVLNVAAKTNIDWCEQNKRECFEANTLGADNVGYAAQEAGAYLVHLSSGCVQESRSAQEVHAEDDPVDPLCYYSWTKVWAENLLMDRLQHRGSGSLLPHPLNVLLFRPRQLLSAVVSPRNALAKMLTYTKFIDTANSCTVIEDLMWVTEKLIEKGAVGLYNVVNPGVTTPYEIATMLKELIKPDMQVVKISKEELDRMTLAKRIDAVLSTDKLAKEGIVLPEIHTRLREIILMLKQNFADTHAAEVMQTVAKETKEKLSLVHNQ